MTLQKRDDSDAVLFYNFLGCVGFVFVMCASSLIKYRWQRGGIMETNEIIMNKNSLSSIKMVK